MIARLAFALGLAVAALAQSPLQVSYVPASGTPQILTSGAQVNVGTFAAGETSALQFQVQNETGIPIVNIQDGLYFSIPDPVPMAVPPGGTLNFSVSFTPPGPPAPIQPSYSALLTIDSFSVLLVANAVGMPNVGDTTGATWLPGDVIAFAHTQVGNSVTKTFELINPYPNAITVSSFSVTGAAFSSPVLSVPLTLAANQSQPFQVTFAPTLPDTNNGSLTVNGQSFGLTGEGFEAPLPAATLKVTGATSDQSATVTIQLASAAPNGGAGTLTLNFQPAAGMPDDPAILFADSGSRTVDVQVQQGNSSANCGDGPCTFQTGTTAGVIAFTLSLGSQTVTDSVTIAPAAVSFDTTTASARVLGSGIAVTLDGFDNTHSTGSLAFTFYDANDKEIPGGVIPVDAATQFTQFFSANAARTGGLFQLQAVFPVTGDISQIATVSVTATNGAGTSTAVQMQIQE